MKYDPTKHHRRSIRLKGYDYHSAGAYFITICTKNRECVLDDLIVNGIINAVWQALPFWFPTIRLDEFIIMPNHIHSQNAEDYLEDMNQSMLQASA